MVSVADTGIGIPPEIIDKVFDPFFTTKEVGKGSGLGLSQVLGVAQQLKGGVRIATEPGFGTVVKVFLPRSRAAGEVENHQPSGDRRAGGAVDRRTGVILLVDDDDEVRAVAAAMLRDAGHTVAEAGSGGAALERLDQDDPPIEMMVADLAMPGMGGIELANAARLSRPDLPILFITGFADTMPADGAALGPLLPKPFRAEELNARVAELLGGRGEQAVIGSPGAAGPIEQNIGA
jgi:CheY-like chemotaxis protein